jgi:hypothetical protein
MALRLVIIAMGSYSTRYYIMGCLGIRNFNIMSMERLFEAWFLCYDRHAAQAKGLLCKSIKNIKKTLAFGKQLIYNFHAAHFRR